MSGSDLKIIFAASGFGGHIQGVNNKGFYVAPAFRRALWIRADGRLKAGAT